MNDIKDHINTLAKEAMVVHERVRAELSRDPLVSDIGKDIDAFVKRQTPDYCKECGMIYYNCLCKHDDE